jgi:putative acetyltransferase
MHLQRDDLQGQAIQNLQRLYLETGTAAAFAPAKRLYERFGFSYTTLFADYIADPYSVFMTKSL